MCESRGRRELRRTQSGLRVSRAEVGGGDHAKDEQWTTLGRDDEAEEAGDIRGITLILRDWFSGFADDTKGRQRLIGCPLGLLILLSPPSLRALRHRLVSTTHRRRRVLLSVRLSISFLSYAPRPVGRQRWPLSFQRSAGGLFHLHNAYTLPLLPRLLYYSTPSPSALHVRGPHTYLTISA